MQGEERNIGIAVVDVADNGGGSLARGGALFAVDEIRDLEGERQVRLVVLGAAGGRDEALELRWRTTELCPSIARGRACGGGLHVDV